MKKLLLLVAGVVFTLFSFSQDLIVINSGDSINCIITRVKKEYIYFTFNHNEEIRSTLLPVSDVSYYKKNFFNTGEITFDRIKTQKNYQQIRIALSGGYSYLTARIGDSVPNDFRDYVKNLKSGFNVGGDLSYYFNETLGIGFKYNLFKSSNAADNIYVENFEGERRYGKMSDNLNISFIGPAFCTRLLNNNRSNALILSTALGYMGYKNDKVIVDRYKMTGNTLGVSFDVGYDMAISDNVYLGIQLTFISGTLAEYKWDNGNSIETIKLGKDELESLNRFDLSVGIRFGL